MTTYDSITVFGDSIAKGVVTINGKPCFEKQCAVTLLEKDFGISIENKSRYGQTITRLFASGAVEKYLSTLDKTKNNLAVIELGGNDSAFDWRVIEKSPLAFHEPSTPLKTFSKSYEELVTLLQNAGVEVWVCSLTPVDSQKYFETVIGSIADKGEVLKFLHDDVNTIARHQSTYNDAVINIAKKYSLPIIDLRTCLENDCHDSLFCEDGIHPTALGQRAIFNTVKTFSTQNLASKNCV